MVWLCTASGLDGSLSNHRRPAVVVSLVSPLLFLLCNQNLVIVVRHDLHYALSRLVDVLDVAHETLGQQTLAAVSRGGRFEVILFGGQKGACG